MDSAQMEPKKGPGAPMWGMPAGSLVKDRGPKVDTTVFPPETEENMAQMKADAEAIFRPNMDDVKGFGYTGQTMVMDAKHRVMQQLVLH